MFVLILYLFIALFFSFLCSLLEAMLLSITPLYATALKKNSPKVGQRILELRKNIDKPLAAILSLNTIAHTVGAAGVGAQAIKVFGSASVGIISAILTFLILIFSEIIPKNLGALYWRRLAPTGTLLIKWLVIILYPLAWISQQVTKIFSPRIQISSITRDELHAMADLGKKEGVFYETESYIFKNLMRFRSLRGQDIMTPRPVIFSLPAGMRIREINEKKIKLNFSRIPLIKKGIEDITHYVLKDDIYLALAQGKSDKRLSDFQRKILIFTEKIPLTELFENLLKTKEQVGLLVDEYGGLSGIVSMEDLLETIIGIEIVDETDTSADMQKMAKSLWEKKAKSLGLFKNKE